MKRLLKMAPALLISAFLLAACAADSPTSKTDPKTPYDSPAPQTTKESPEAGKITEEAPGTSQNSPASPANGNQTPQISGPGAGSPEAPADGKKLEERAVTLKIPGGGETRTTVTRDDKTDGYKVMFSPPVEPTDENLYAVSLQLLNEFYGAERGLILPEKANMQDLPAGQFVCWQIENPGRKFCVSQMRVSDADKRLAGIMFFAK